ncbi:MAG: 50S ribosomal protein L10 [Rickettsiaceae bacterium H1]|nr:50S ribosomal protein L10 [Rickettsiaceae bacterium H1]
MKKQKKEILIGEIRSIFKSFSTVIIVRLSGFNAMENSELRSRLWSEDADLKVVKNSLLEIVLLEFSFSDIAEKLSGEIAILHSNDVLSLSKLFCDVMKNTDNLSMVSMIHEGEIFYQDKIHEIAKLPNLVSLQAQLISLLNNGVGGKLARLLDNPKQQVFNMVKFCANC